MTIRSRSIALAGLAGLAALIATPAFAATAAAAPAGDQVVISEIYGGGAQAADSSFAADFVELYNPTAAAIDLNGHTLTQWGTNDFPGSVIATLSGSIGAGQYYLVALGAGSAGSGAALPTPDATGTANIGSANGRVSLFAGETRLDTVAYGTGGFPEGAAAATPSNTTSIRRDAAGTDTNNNRNDFALGTPTPTNSAGQTGIAAPAFQDATLTIVSATAVEGQPGSVVVKVSDPSGNPVTSGEVRITLNGLRTTFGSPVDATGTATLATTASGLGTGAALPIGEYPLVVNYVNGAGFNPATLNGSYTVTAAALPDPVITSYQSCDSFGFNVAGCQAGDQLRIDGFWNGQAQFTTVHITAAGWWSGSKPSWESATAVVIRDGVALEQTRISISTEAACLIVDITPQAPQFSDVNGWKHDRVIIPATAGVHYYLNGQPVAAGSYQVTKAQTVTVTAVAAEGFRIAEDAESSWTHSFRNNNGKN